MMKLFGRICFAGALAMAVCLPSAAVAQLPPSERVVIAYSEPTNRSHLQLYNALRSGQALERARDALAPIRWPRPLKLEVKSCDEPNAWYNDATITVCYEFLAEIWARASSRKRPSTVSLEDAFVAPSMDVLLHEAGHALFDLMKVPVLGREEDAADQFAAYAVLKRPKEQAHRLVIAAAYSQGRALKVTSARDLYRPRLSIGRHVNFADEHGTPAQRLYNLLCLAYGSDKVLFSDVVDLGFLPKERAEICELEYNQVDFAYRTLIAPLMDASR